MAETPKSKNQISLENLTLESVGADSAGDGEFFDVEPIDVAGTPFGPDAEFEEIELVSKPEKQNKKDDKAKSVPPSAVEWQDFFARFVIRGMTRGYLALVLRDIEDDLTPAEREKIQLTDEDLQELAMPMASFSSKNSFMKKHGRSIVSAADSSEALIGLFFWMRRVNKIASKHRRNRTIQGQVIAEETHVSDGQDATEWAGPQYPQGNFFNPGSGG